MAKVISWAINNMFAYLGGVITGTTVEAQIRDKDHVLTDEEINSLAAYWRDKGETEYINAFNGMKALAESMFGKTNLKPANYYYNVFGSDGVIIVSGKDGENTYDTGTPYYSLHILNQNMALGLGSDYVLDTPVTATTEIYIERDGVIKNSEIANVTVGDVPDATFMRNEDRGTVSVNIPLSVGTDFENLVGHSKIFEINVTCRNSFTASTYFSVTGIKNGEEGSFFNLTVSPKIIKKSGNYYSQELVNVFCTKNGEIQNGLEIKYLSGDTRYIYNPDSPLYAEDIDAAPGNTVTFELYYNGNLIDADTCSVVKDGIDATTVARVELDNEMDGVSLGDSRKLYNPVIIGSGAKLLTGASETNITKIAIEGISTNRDVVCRIKDGNEWTEYAEFSQNEPHKVEFNLISQPYETSFEIKFKENFEFNTDYKETISITLTGGSYNNITASTNYIVLAIKGGENGKTFKIQPSVDCVLYDPNSDVFSVEEVSCTAYTGTEEITSPSYTVGYTTNFAYNSYNECVESGQYVEENVFSGISNNISSITFYLFYETDGGTHYMVDRETVPVIVQGLNGTRIYLELEDEISPIGLGGDEKLDNPVKVETKGALYSGSTTLEFNSIKITADNGLNGTTCDIVVDGGTLTKKFANGVVYVDESELLVNDGSFSFAIYLQAGLTFDNSQKKLLTVEIGKKNGRGIYTFYRTIYTIFGIKNGEDGVAYSLLPSESSIKYNPNTKEFSPGEISCEAYAGKNRIDNLNKYEIRHTIDEAESSYDATEEGNSVDLTECRTIDRVYFYLFDVSSYDKILLDRESVPVLQEGENASSPYFLDLDNQNTSINCDSDGNVLPGAVLPECTATLYYGDTVVDGAEYSIEETTASGVVIDTESGEITLDPETFGFEGKTLCLTVIGAFNGLTFSAKYNISKNFSGVNYWLSPSTNSIKIVDDAQEYYISCAVYKQINGESPEELDPEEIDGIKVFFGYDTELPENVYDGAIETIENDKQYICFRLSGDGVQYDIETIPILHENVRYWLVASEDTIKVTDGVNLYQIFCLAYKQSNGQNPEELNLAEVQSPKVYFKQDEDDSFSHYTGGTVHVTPSKGMVTFVMSGDNTEYFIKTISFIADGERGPQGETGAKGDNGVTMRKSVWEPNKTYYNGEIVAPDGNYYYDIITDKYITVEGEETPVYKYCKRTHYSDSDNKYNADDPTHILSGNSTYWGDVQNSEPLSTPLLLAEKIDAKYIAVDELVAKSVKTNDDEIQTIIEQGRFMIMANNKKRIEFGYVNGNVVLIFYDQNENPLYNLGPDGITNILEERANSWTSSSYMLISSGTISNSANYSKLTIPSNAWTKESSWTFPIYTKSGVTVYTYSNGYQKVEDTIAYYNPRTGKYELAFQPEENGKQYLTSGSTGTAYSDNYVPKGCYYHILGKIGQSTPLPPGAVWPSGAKNAYRIAIYYCNSEGVLSAKNTIYFYWGDDTGSLHPGEPQGKGVTTFFVY